MLIDWILAISPILLILVLMVRFRWGGAKAGPAGLFLAVIVAAARFGAGAELLALAQVKALLLTLDVLLIIWAAYLLYRVTEQAGAIAVLSDALPALTRDRVIQALLIGWAFASFLQGVGGFGVPVAVTAPLLIGLGFPPLTAVVIPSIGHAWGTTFGSLATSFQALIAASGVPGEILGPPAALLLGGVGLACGALVAHAAGGWAGVRRAAVNIIILAGVMAAVQYFLVIHGLWNLGGLGAGMAGLAVGFALTIVSRRDCADQAPGRYPRADVILALVGYVALIVFTVSVQLIPLFREFFGRLVIRVPFPELETGRGFVTPAGYGREIPLFRHAGALLGYATVVSYIVYRWTGRLRAGAGAVILRETAKRMAPSSLGILTMVAMAIVMSHAGMTEVLALGLASVAGAFFPFVSPWIGALGAFMTGSNTNSNVVFALLQRRTAEVLRLSVAWILAAQTAGGAVGSVIAPTKLIVGASTTGLAGEEGRILRALAGYIAALLCMISLALGLLVWLGLV